MKILLAINSLMQGGAQKFTIDFATELYSEGNDVTLLIFYPIETDFFQIPEGVKVIRFIKPFQDNNRNLISPISILRVIELRIKRIFWRLKDWQDLRRIIIEIKPDITIGIERYIGILLGLLHPTSIPLVISERVHPDFHKIPRIFRFLGFFVYKRKNIFIHAQGHQIANDIKKKVNKSIAVIPNIVYSQQDISIRGKENPIKVAVCFGRYDSQKGYDLLIESWSKLPVEIRNNWELHIYGDNNPEKYASLVKQFALDNDIKLFGPTKNVAGILDSADLYIMTSRYEGFPNALAEAMVSGVPCLVADSPSAIREMTSDGKLAKLCELNIESITSSLKVLMTNSAIRQNYGTSGKVILRYYSKEIVMATWFEYLQFVKEIQEFENIFMDCPKCGKKSKYVDFRMRTQILTELQQYWQIHHSDLNNQIPRVVKRYKCTNCEISFFNSKPGDETFYKDCHASPIYQRESNWDYIKIIDFGISHFKSEKIRILDFGSGYTKFIDLNNHSNLEIEALEIDEKTRHLMHKKGIRTYKSKDEIKSNFQLIMVSHFLEHVEFPSKFIEEVKELLAPDGILAVTVPDAEFNEKMHSVLDWPPHHTYRFTQFGLKNLIKSKNLKYLETLVAGEKNDGSNFDFCSVFRFVGD